MKQGTFYFKEYDISHIDFEDITERVNSRILKTAEFPERLNATNTSNLEKGFGYACEEIVFELDKEVTHSVYVGEKYDYEKKGEYIDLKGVKTNAILSKIIERQYTIMLLAEQVWLAQNWCDDNKVSYSKYRYEIVWWNGLDGKFIRSSNYGLYLDQILLKTPVRGRPVNTYGTTEEPWQFEIEMVGEEGTNIIL